MIKGIGSLDPEVIIVMEETPVHWVYSLSDTQSWECAEYKTEEADRHTVSEAGKSAMV